MPGFFGVKNDKGREKKYNKTWFNFLKNKKKTGKYFTQLDDNQLKYLSEILGKHKLDTKENKPIVNMLLKLNKQDLLTEKQIKELDELTLKQLAVLSLVINDPENLFEEIYKDESNKYKNPFIPIINPIIKRSELISELKSKNPKQEPIQNTDDQPEITQATKKTLVIYLTNFSNKTNQLVNQLIEKINQTNIAREINQFAKNIELKQLRKAPKSQREPLKKIIEEFHGKFPPQKTIEKNKTLVTYLIKVANEIKQFVENIELKPSRKSSKSQRGKIRNINVDLTQGLFKQKGKTQNVGSNTPKKR
jgi:hypothetical protein